MSDRILPVTPSAPHRQPAPDAWERPAALLLELVSGPSDDLPRLEPADHRLPALRRLPTTGDPSE
ncbi:hypothetical protein [Streptomyces puniciscabiei]|uniref:hypothetical protein n=1 Tax=Streptomyces puniciscabiei TaxID=164348 RepID=UPI000AD92E23|nr:hypothetical protein [Streptomyces puniciscabiei]